MHGIVAWVGNTTTSQHCLCSFHNSLWKIERIHWLIIVKLNKKDFISWYRNYGNVRPVTSIRVTFIIGLTGNQTTSAGVEMYTPHPNYSSQISYTFSLYLTSHYVILSVRASYLLSHLFLSKSSQFYGPNKENI